MGFTAIQVNEMSMWQFMAQVEGYVKANTDDDGTLSNTQIDELWEWMQSKEGA